MNHRVDLPTGYRLVARRKLEGHRSCMVDLELYRRVYGEDDAQYEWLCSLDEAKWSPNSKRLLLRGQDSVNALAQHGVRVDELLAEIAVAVGFPVQAERGAA